MKLSRFFFISLCISMATVACYEDDMGFVPSENEEVISTADLTGYVMDPDGNPVVGASVKYDLEEAVTDDNGYYSLETVEVSSEHASLQVTKDGFFSGSRTFRSTDSGTIFHRTTLVPVGDPLTLDGGTGSVATSLVNIEFPENSIKDEATGDVYTGTVEVFIKHIGTDELSMPGDLTAINENNELEILHSYGMVYVELYAEDGRKLNVADGMTASMSYEIPADLLATAPESIKMWWYDYDAGLWREGGQAIREGSRWIGEVSHFSCWNFDLNVPSVVVSGQIVQSNGGQSKFYVSFINENGQGGRGSANADGSFSGRVEAGVSLQLTIRYHETNCDIIIYQEIVGPFDQDTDLGDIIVNTDSLPSKPMARFTVNEDDIEERKYYFTNTSTVSGIADISFTSSWDFGGDGTSTDDSPEHTFSSTGLHDISLTITAADGEVSTVTQTIDVGGISNKYARVTDTQDSDMGELRLQLDQAILTGRVTFNYRVSEGQEMHIGDAFVKITGPATTGDMSITEIRIKDDAIHEFREGASSATDAAANFPMGIADAWIPVEISWTGDGTAVPTYSVTMSGQTVITDAISTTNGGPDDVDDHLANVVNGALNFHWLYNFNSGTSDGLFDIDNIKVYSSDSGAETTMFQDNFEGRLKGDNLDPEVNLNSPYHQNCSEATVGEDL